MAAPSDRWSDDIQQYVVVMSHAGWDPFNPSPECARAVARPYGLGHLDWLDGAGIQTTLVYLKLCSRFLRGEQWTKERERFLLAASYLFLMIEIRPRVEWDTDEFRSLIRQIEAWHARRRAGSARRLARDDKRHGGDYVWKHRARYEPDFTLGLLTLALGLGDVEGDRKRMAIGLAMHVEGRRRPRRIEPITVETLAGLFSVATRDGRTISRWDDRGLMGVRSKLAKGGLDSELGRTSSRPREITATDLEPVGAADSVIGSQAASVPKDGLVERRDLAEAVRAIVARRCLKAKPGLRRAVLQNFEDLAADEHAAERVALENGVTARGVRKLYQAEREAVRRQLSA